MRMPASPSITPVGVGTAALFLLTWLSCGALAASAGRDTLADPIAACRGPVHSEGPTSAVELVQAIDGTLVVTNVASQCIDQLTLGDGQRRYRVGRVTPELLVDDILEGSAPDALSSMATIWSWTSNAFAHYCSQGSPFLVWWERSGSLLGRIYSNSFGCCSDVNHPILSSLLEIAGIPAWIFYSDLHVAVQAGDLSTGAAYLDADHEFMLPGSLFTQDHSSYPAYYFMDYLDYRGLYTDEAVAADPGLVLNRSGVVDPEPTTLALAGGDSLWFTSEPARTSVVALPPIAPEDSVALERTSDTKLGIADLDLRSFFDGIDESTPERCAKFSIEFPYAMIDSAVIKVPRRAQVFLVDEADAASPIEPAPVQDWVLRVGEARRARMLISDEFDSWGTFRFGLRVCDVPAKRLTRARLRILFQYNDRILPSDRQSVTVEEVRGPNL